MIATAGAISMTGRSHDLVELHRGSYWSSVVPASASTDDVIDLEAFAEAHNAWVRDRDRLVTAPVAVPAPLSEDQR